MSQIAASEMDRDSFESGSPAEAWNHESANRVLDELFSIVGQYRDSRSYVDLMKFVGRFRNYSPFNAMLAYIQMPGAKYIAPAGRWMKDYGRRIKTGRNPIVLLRPKGPVMFVFDVSDTEPLDGAPNLPAEVTNPFQVRSGKLGNELDKTIMNAARDGVSVLGQDAGSQLAGSIRCSNNTDFMNFTVAEGPLRRDISVPVLYEMLLNTHHSKETLYTTLVHELAHLYCGHLSTPHESWWPDRRGLGLAEREFEAESVSYLVCARLGLDNPSEKYLSEYLKGNDEIPEISLDCIVRAGFLIEKMGKRKMQPRKEMIERFDQESL